MGTEQYKLAGREIAPHSADLQQILDAIGERYKTMHKPGLVLILEPDTHVPWRFPYWFISFNPADLSYPHDWFHEASSNMGHLFNQKLHGPRAVDHFTEYLRKEQ